MNLLEYYESGYSCPHLVRPKSEELISRPFVGEIQFQLVLLKRVETESAMGCFFFLLRSLNVGLPSALDFDDFLPDFPTENKAYW